MIDATDLIFEGILDEFPDAVVGIDIQDLKVVFVSKSPSTSKPRINVMKAPGFCVSTIRKAYDGDADDHSTTLVPSYHYDTVDNEQGIYVIEADNIQLALDAVYDSLNPHYREKVHVMHVDEAIKRIGDAIALVVHNDERIQHLDVDYYLSKTLDDDFLGERTVINVLNKFSRKSELGPYSGRPW